MLFDAVMQKKAAARGEEFTLYFRFEECCHGLLDMHVGDVKLCNAHLLSLYTSFTTQPKGYRDTA
jgi:hypothetical protein